MSGTNAPSGHDGHPLDPLLDALNTPSPAFVIDPAAVRAAGELIHAHGREDAQGFLDAEQRLLTSPAASVHAAVVALTAIAGVLANQAAAQLATAPATVLEETVNALIEHAS